MIEEKRGLPSRGTEKVQDTDSRDHRLSNSVSSAPVHNNSAYLLASQNVVRHDEILQSQVLA